MPGYLGYEFYQYEADGIDSTYTSTGSDDTLVFRGPWDGHMDFCKEIIGKEEVMDDDTVKIIVHRPALHPRIPNCYAETVRVKNFGEPIGNPNGILTWDEVLVSVYFRTPEFPVEGEQPYRVTNLVSSNEFQTVEGFAWTFASGQDVQAPIPIEMRRVDFQVQSYRVPRIPFELFDGNGCVNNNDYTIDDIGTFPAGTLLLSGVEATVQVSTGFNRSYTSNYAMAYRHIPWNKELNPFTRDYEYINLKGYPSKRKYREVDFSKFFYPVELP